MKKRVLAGALTVLLAASLPLSIYAADVARRDNLRSVGVFEYQEGGNTKVRIDSNDLYMLADDIDDIELSLNSMSNPNYDPSNPTEPGKEPGTLDEAEEKIASLGDGYMGSLLGKLNDMHTYVNGVNSDGTPSVTHDPSVGQTAGIDDLTFPLIISAVGNTQDIYGTWNKPTDVDGNGTIADGETAVADLTGAVANNLTAGTAAWVNGEYVIGNGADNNAYYNRGYADGVNKAYNADIKITYHVHDASTTTRSATAVGFNAYTAAKSGLSEDYRTSSSGCYTKQWYSATKTVKTYHPATAGTQKQCEGYWVVTSVYTYTPEDGAYYDAGYRYGATYRCNKCGFSSGYNNVNNPGGPFTVGATGGRCTQTTTTAGTAAYWSTDSTTNVTGWGACPSNSNNGSTEITYSNVSYRYYPNCGHTNGQISKIELDLD